KIAVSVECENRNRSAGVTDDELRRVRKSTMTKARVCSYLVNLPQAAFWHSISLLCRGSQLVRNHWLRVQIRARLFGCRAVNHNQTCILFKICKSRFPNLICLQRLHDDIDVRVWRRASGCEGNQNQNHRLVSDVVHTSMPMLKPSERGCNAIL